MKYFLVLILIISLRSLGQDYSAQLTTHRKTYAAEFLKDKHSPLSRSDLKLLRFYDADSTYNIVAKVEILPSAPGFIMPVFSGNGSEYTRYALLKFLLKGKAMRLTVYKSTALSGNSQYADYLFLPFTDKTNGEDTYTGGRYIDLSVKEFKNDTVIIDFNKAYNPYCAYSAGYSCPKPPDENKLEIKVEAGEKNFAGKKKH
ncbi:MAG: DUF1684 domain-containing protein [Agriterribacter sp.]